MVLNSLHIFQFLLLLGSSAYCQAQNSDLAAQRTRAIAHLFSYIQCFPSNLSAMDGPSQELLQVHENFKPLDHLDEYKNRTAAIILFDLVDQLKNNGTPNDLPFTNIPADIARMNIILQVLYHNADNWSLFYDTATWLLHRVNVLQLWYALKITSLEKFSDLVTTASAVETFPQLFAPKELVLPAAGVMVEKRTPFPLQYWTTDPNLHDFHVQWHMDNPFWWEDKVWGVTRHRKGELFLYMHHQLICRYRAEWASIGMKGNVEPLGIEDDDKIPEGYIPDVVNVDYADFFSREDGKRIGDYGPSLASLRISYARLIEGIDQGFFVGPGNTTVPLAGFNGINKVGATSEASRNSTNQPIYGSFHNLLHRQLAGLDKPGEFLVPGIQAHAETAMRDPIFYRIHSRVDTIYMKYKSTTKPYTQKDLDFRGVYVRSVTIRRSESGYKRAAPWEKDTDDLGISSSSPVLTTFFKTVNYDISTAARPCRAVNDKPISIPVQILDHEPFSYEIIIFSKRPRVAYGMVRIFLWPEYSQNGSLLQGDDAHRAAIELDRFRIRLDPNRVAVITRSSLNSSATHQDPIPGIKQLYNVKKNSPLITDPTIRRACGFPNNLLIPRGTTRGMGFKLIVYVSDETDAADKGDYPNFPLCGALNGKAYPDSRPMGFPFDRPGTRFNVQGGGGTIKNLKEMRVVIKHHE